MGSLLRRDHSILPKLTVREISFVGYEDLLKEDEYIFQQLTKEGEFDLDFVPFNDIFKKELLSKTQTISRYVKDKALLAKAAELERHCFALSQNQRAKQAGLLEVKKPG